MNDSMTLNTYKRKVDKSTIPVCKILGVNISAIGMEWLIEYLNQNISDLSGDYICVSNVHTTIMSYENAEYCAVQNNGIMAIPDGGPLSTVGRHRGYKDMGRTAGPSLMEAIFGLSDKMGYRHFFYGSTDETLRKMQINLKRRYPNIQIVGMYSPPFRKLKPQEDNMIINEINKTKPNFVWVGLGAPKQEIWMADHQGKVAG